MSDAAADELNGFQERIGHRFRDESLLIQSLSHPSLQQDGGETINNQRLEFLGDAVLQLIISERLHKLHPTEREGDLTRRRAALTRGDFLAALALELGVDRVLRVSASERQLGGHTRPAALEDAVEALVAAIYLDSDWSTARAVVLRWLEALGDRISESEEGMNPKGRLQELIQPTHGNAALAYRVVGVEGPPHERRFEVEAVLHGEVLGRGAGSSKKDAEEQAAREALRNWPPAAK